MFNLKGKLLVYVWNAFKYGKRILPPTGTAGGFPLLIVLNFFFQKRAVCSKFNTTLLTIKAEKFLCYHIL